MEYAKKMVLVPAESVQKLQQGPVSTDPMEALHSELTQVLRSRSMNDAEKWAHYQQLLERCLRHADQRRKPFSFTIEEGRRDDDARGGGAAGLPPERAADGAAAGPLRRAGGGPASGALGPVLDALGPVSGARRFQDVLATIPVTYRSKGSLLLEKLANSELINWKDDGRVQIGQKLIPGAHISDLLNDVLRDRKTVRTPTGAEDFYKVLAQLNVPNELIGNPRRWDLIRRFALGFASPGSPSVDTLWPESPRFSVPPRETPQTSRSTGAIPRTLNWESFSFKKSKKK